MRNVALGLVALVLLAGCSGGGGSTPTDEQAFEDLDLQATATTGVLRGIVVDDAVRPIAGAAITLRPPNGGAELTTESTESGAFAFDGLEPGTHFIQVSKLGFLPSQSSAEVVAGVAEPAIVKVLLGRDTSFRPPYYEQYVFEGFMECSTGGAVAGGYAYLNACSSSPEAFPNDKTTTENILTDYPDWVQSEMSWQSTQTVSQSLALNFYYADPGEEDGIKDQSAEGVSPLINSMDNGTTKEYIEGLDYEEGTDLVLRQRVFTRATDGTGPALTVQQRFTVVTTVFYGYLPPTGWTFTESGEVPPPPT